MATNNATDEFPEMGNSQIGGFLLESPIQLDDLGVPLFQETSIYVRIHATIFTTIIWEAVFRHVPICVRGQLGALKLF